MKINRTIFIITTQLMSILLLTGILHSQTWQFTNGPYRPHEVRDLSASLSGGIQRIYAADVEKLKYSTNGGTSWLETGTPLLNALVVASKPNNPNMVHVGKLGRLDRSTTGGNSWENPAKLEDLNLVPLRLSESTYDPDIWFLGADTVLRGTNWTTSLYRTINNGTDWSAVNYFRNDAHTNANDAVHHPTLNKVWIGGSRNPLNETPDADADEATPTKGVWYSADGGVYWSFQPGTPGVPSEQLGGGSTHRNVSAIGLSYNTPSDELLFAAVTWKDGSTVKAKLYQSGNNGQSWTTTADMYTQIGVSQVRTIKVNPYGSQGFNTIIAATNKGFAISTNRGFNWTLRNVGLEDVQTSYQVMFDKNDATGNTIYIGTDETVYKSTDQGLTWSSNTGIFNFMNVSGFTINGTTAHGVSNSYTGIGKMTSSVWDQTPRMVGQKQFSGEAVAINWTNTQYANACGDSGGRGAIYVRTDGADGWMKVFTSDAGYYSTRFLTLAADPKANSQRVYAGGKFYIGSQYYYNFMRSTNLGVNWDVPVKIGGNDGVPVNTIVIDPTQGYYAFSITIYAGLGADGGAGLGVRKSVDGGATWPGAQLNGNSITAIAMNPPASTQIIYLSSLNAMWKSTNALDSPPSPLYPFFGGATRILMHPSYPNSTAHLWVIASDGQKIYKTANSGANWVEILTTGVPKPLNDLQRDPTNNTLIYAATSEGVYKIDPKPEPPSGFIVRGTTCTPTTCQTLAGGLVPLAPGPCYPILSWSPNLEVDLATSGTYTLQRKIGSGSWVDIASGTTYQYTDGEVQLSSTGTIYVYYRVKAKDAAGNNSDYSNVICVMAKSAPSVIAIRNLEELNEQIVYEYKLFDNYPNPFNPTTVIRYSLPEQQHVRLIVYDILGREIKTLVDDIQSEGFKEVQFNPAISGGLASGVYFYRIHAGSFTDIKKMVFAQ